EKPNWILSAGNLLDRTTWSNLSILKYSPRCDHVVINPPFSMKASHGVLASWGPELFRCSLSMSHLLATLKVFAPRFGGAAVVPESLMFSERDAQARAALEQDYLLDVVRSLKNTTFRGARANALVVQ